MAVDISKGHPAMDYPEHLKTYKMFVRGSMYLVAGVAAILIFLALFVA